MSLLNLPSFEYQIKTTGKNPQIFDIIRKKFVILSPEEWVRQHFVHYLINELQYPKALIAIERGTNYNKLSKRTDICVYNREGQPLMLVECKAAEIRISEEVVKQVFTYNKTIGARFIVITNGLEHYCWEFDKVECKTHSYNHIPNFNEIG